MGKEETFIKTHCQKNYLSYHKALFNTGMLCIMPAKLYKYKTVNYI